MKADIIRKVLLSNGILLVDIAKELGISPQHLNNIFATNDVKVGTLLKISKVSEIPIIFFMNECENVHDSDKTFKEVYDMYSNWYDAKLNIGIIKPKNFKRNE